MEFEIYKYNPHKAPDSEKWLAMDEGDRIQVIADFHLNANIELESVQAHSAIHAMVENQLAEKIPEVVAAYRKLRQKKVDRHNAIHAIGSVLAELFFDINKGNVTDSDPNVSYYRNLKKLKASDWKR